MVAREDWKIQLYVGTAALGCPIERSSIASLPLSPAIESYGDLLDADADELKGSGVVTLIL
jgi:hypothetical protein